MPESYAFQFQSMHTVAEKCRAIQQVESVLSGSLFCMKRSVHPVAQRIRSLRCMPSLSSTGRIRKLVQETEE